MLDFCKRCAHFDIRMKFYTKAQSQASGNVQMCSSERRQAFSSNLSGSAALREQRFIFRWH
jgi:hypothetical protein